MVKATKPQFHVVRDNVYDVWVVERLGYGVISPALWLPFSRPELTYGHISSHPTEAEAIERMNLYLLEGTRRVVAES